MEAFEELQKLYQISDRNTLEFECPLSKLEVLFSATSRPPTTITDYDPNSAIFTNIRKKSSHNAIEEQQQPLQTQHEERKKVYKPGPFAKFYEQTEGKADKDAEVWYYKDHKEIIGPVSNYNMDRMYFFRKVDAETRVAFKSIEKFVKFAKILKILDPEAAV